MERHHVKDVIFHLFFTGEPADERLHKGHALALVFVSMDASVLLFGRNYLSQIMSQSQQHEAIWFRHTIPERCGSVYDFHRMWPDIALRVENRILFKAYSLTEFREPDIKLIHRAQRFEKY